MIISLLTGTTYDTSKPEERLRLLKYIPNLKSLGRKSELAHIVKQITEAKQEKDEEAIYLKAGGKKTITITPPSPQPIIAPPPVPLPIVKQAELSPQAPEYDPQKTETEENGETSFQNLYAYLMLDMQKYTGDINFLIAYSSLITNMFVHAATFTPVDGHGKAQRREYDNGTQLQYFRSQGEHTNGKFFRDLIKLPSEKEETPQEVVAKENKKKKSAPKSRGPLNKGFIKLISQPDFSNEFCADIKKIDPTTGVPKPGKEVDKYVITKLAHAGARKNNFSCLVQGMQLAIGNLQGQPAIEKLQTKLKHVLPPKELEHVLPAKKKQQALDLQTLSARIRGLLQAFPELKSKMNDQSISSPKLSSHLLDYRIQRIQNLRNKIKPNELKNISLDSSANDVTFLLIRLYPDCKKDDATYKEGVTNVLVSVFGALLNHHLKLRGLKLYAERRQSFGFLRPTLTDAGNLTIRLSLGLEPTVFDDVVLQSLRDLDALTGKFNFENPNHEAVEKVFARLPLKAKKKEAKKQDLGKKPRKQRQGDTYIQNVVRKDNNTLVTFQQAEAYIHQAYVQGGDDYLARGMENFLINYVRGKTKLKNAPINYDKEVSPIQPCVSAIVDLLKNILNYAFAFVARCEFLATDDPLAAWAHCYWHSLSKLYNNVAEGQMLLADLEKMEASEFFRRANLIAENILEYLISLDALMQERSRLQNKAVDPIKKLRDTELNYAAHTLNIAPQRLQLHFTDSGQQAITTALLVMQTMLHGPAADGKTHDQDLHLFGKSYYEVSEFIHDIKKQNSLQEMADIARAKIVFADVTQLAQLDMGQCRAMHALVIDITHHPLLDRDLLKQVVAQAQQKNCWVVLVESSLKHNELGLDKYQAGKIFTLAPPGKTLSAAAVDMFDMVSNEAMTDEVASYLQMVNEIGQEKMVKPTEAPIANANADRLAAQKLSDVGMFKTQQVTDNGKQELHDFSNMKNQKSVGSELNRMVNA